MFKSLLPKGQRWGEGDSHMKKEQGFSLSCLGVQIMDFGVEDEKPNILICQSIFRVTCKKNFFF